MKKSLLFLIVIMLLTLAAFIWIKYRDQLGRVRINTSSDNITEIEDFEDLWGSGGSSK